MDNNINEIIQYALVAIIVTLAIIWLLKKYSLLRKIKLKHSATLVHMRQVAQK